MYKPAFEELSPTQRGLLTYIGACGATALVIMAVTIVSDIWLGVDWLSNTVSPFDLNHFFLQHLLFFVSWLFIVEVQPIANSV